MSQVQQSFVLNDFLGYFSGSTCPAGGIVDMGEFQTPMRSQGFQLTSGGKLEKSHGCSIIGTDFDHAGFSLIQGMFYARSGPCAALFLAGYQNNQIALKVLRVKSDTPGTTPYMLRPETLTLEPHSSEGGSWSAPGSSRKIPWVIGSFAQYQDRIYFANGLDYPIRVNGLGSVFVNSTVDTAHYSAMGVSEYGGNLTIGYNIYAGNRANASGVNSSFSRNYFYSVVTSFGESGLTYLECPSAPSGTMPGDFSYPIVYISNWSAVNRYILGFNIYRMAVGGSVPQYVGMVQRNTSFVDTLDDGELGGPHSTLCGRPSLFRYLCSYGGRMFAIGGYGGINNLFCSRVDYPDVWPPTYQLDLSSHIQNKTVNGICVISGSLYVFLDTGILKLFGSTPDNFDFQVVSDRIGCIAPKTLFPFQDGRVFLSDMGMMFFNGSDLKRIGNFSSEELVGSTRGSVSLYHSCAAVNGDQILLSYRDDSEKKWIGGSTPPMEGVCPNRTITINFSNDSVGVIGDWAFWLSCPGEGSESFVLGGDVVYTADGEGEGPSGGGGIPGFHSVTVDLTDHGTLHVEDPYAIGYLDGPLVQHVVWVNAGQDFRAHALADVGEAYVDTVYIDGTLWYSWVRDKPSGCPVIWLHGLTGDHTVLVVFTHGSPP